MILTIENDGPRIVRTNYWSSEHAARGAFYVSVNAGAFRVLVPEAVRDVVAEMRTAKEVVISRGPWPAERRDDALELLFDDGSASPFALHIGVEQIDRLPSAQDDGRSDLRCPAWMRGIGDEPIMAL